MNCHSQLFILKGGRPAEVKKKKKSASPSLHEARSRGTKLHNTGSKLTTHHEYFMEWGAVKRRDNNYSALPPHCVNLETPLLCDVT